MRLATLTSTEDHPGASQAIFTLPLCIITKGGHQRKILLSHSEEGIFRRQSGQRTQMAPCQEEKT